jgi:hypothetical protein
MNEVTTILSALEQGDDHAADQLLPRMAGRHRGDKAIKGRTLLTLLLTQNLQERPILRDSNYPQSSERAAARSRHNSFC